ncbi:hypothetical protein [Gillisia hiemivivida]|uniref:hypothetical protein n=1 Tax=Gillisia hiemivivida TaxID=291190 RepID=UPI001B862874|nr:hypothetical protein [Gillisia hiemivivida]
MGLFYYPYWMFFELGAPIVEFVGLLSLIVFTILGLINWNIAILFFVCVYLLGCIFSTISIFIYVKNFKH